MDHQTGGFVHKHDIFIFKNNGYRPLSRHNLLSAVIGHIEKVPECFNRYQVADTGRPSRTEYEVLSEFTYEETPFSLVRLKLQTGRTHQIRVHMASLSHPLLGDSIYGHEGFLGFDRAALHSFEITCQLPGHQDLAVFSSEMPEDFQKMIAKSINFSSTLI